MQSYKSRFCSVKIWTYSKETSVTILLRMVIFIYLVFQECTLNIRSLSPIFVLYIQISVRMPFEIDTVFESGYPNVMKTYVLL